MFKGSDKEMKRTGTNRSDKGGNGLQRTTSSYQGAQADQTRYSDRQVGDQSRLTASQLHKTKTLEERLKQAEAQNATRK